MIQFLLTISKSWIFRAVLGVILTSGIGWGVTVWDKGRLNQAKAVGDAIGYSRGYAQSLKDNPPNVYNGPSTINQQPQIMYSFLGLKIGSFGFGFVKDKKR